MITREEYNKALDILKAYRKQLFIDSVSDSLMDLENTPVLKWDKFEKCSTRLQTVLRTAEHYNNKYDCCYYIETIDWSQFKQIRNAGRKSWTEFVELRGC
tara:strand:- start:157 stop:456 length:300 start_codon:yes stop_codon:yes gene_type:complete